MLEGARRVGKSTIAEEFARNNFRSYIKVDFANVEQEVLDAFDDIASLDIFTGLSKSANSSKGARSYYKE